MVIFLLAGSFTDNSIRTIDFPVLFLFQTYANRYSSLLSFSSSILCFHYLPKQLYVAYFWVGIVRTENNLDFWKQMEQGNNYVGLEEEIIILTDFFLGVLRY